MEWWLKETEEDGSQWYETEDKRYEILVRRDGKKLLYVDSGDNVLNWNEYYAETFEEVEDWIDQKKGNLLPAMRYRVTLASGGSSEDEQDPDEPFYGTPEGWAIVTSLKEAARTCRSYMAHFELGTNNWKGGTVWRGEHLVAKVSFKGKIKKERMTSK